MYKYYYLRKKLLKYHKSGRYVVVPYAERGSGSHVLDLDKNFKISNFRALKGIPKNSALDYTNYSVDLEKIVDGSMVSYNILRIIHNDDIDLKKWDQSIPIDELNLLSSSHLTVEERFWAGAREGNPAILVIGGIGLYFLTSSSYDSFQQSLWVSFSALSILTLLLIIFAGIFIKDIFPCRPNKVKILELLKHKENLIKKTESERQKKLSTLDQKIRDFAYWESLDPKQFEYALGLYLKKRGYNLIVSRYAGDGGIDLEGSDKDNKRVIIQAKKYTKPVGVSVVREMLGIKNSMSDRDSLVVMIYALNGFTKGAHQFADENGIILRSIRQDLID